MKVIAIASLKGGVGKTTTTIFLSQIIASKGKRVLTIDMDGQGSLTDYFLRKEPVEKILESNSYHLLTERKSIDETIFKQLPTFVDTIPGSPQLHNLSVEMAGDPTALLRFPKEIRSTEYDYVFIDCPPANCYELRAGLFGADEIIIPVSLDRWGFQGLYLLDSLVKRFSKSLDHPPKIKILPVLVTQKEAEKIQGDLKSKGFEIFDTIISRNTQVRTATSSGKPLKIESKSFMEFESLAKEVLI